MSQTNAPLTPAAAPVAPVPAPRGPRERRIRFGHLALAIALVVVGALGAATLVVVASAEGEYLALADDMQYGEQFETSDLVRVRISNAPGIEPVPASQMDRVVGNYATMPLAAGTLLTGAHVAGADEREPGDDEVRIGVTLSGDRLPGRLIEAGQRILLVETPDGTSASSDDDEAPLPRTWEATVVGVSGEGSGDGLLGSRSRGTTLDVIVDEDEGPTIVALAAADELSVAVLPGQSGD